MNRRDFLLKSGLAASLGLLAKGTLSAQTAAPTATSPAPAPTPAAGSGAVRQPAPVTTFSPLRRNVGYFTGSGGSIGWLSAADALVAGDTQVPATAAVFLQDLPGRHGPKPDAGINTHHHRDHTGGNGVFRPVTKTIIAQANVPELMRAAAKRNRNPPAGNLEDMIPDTTFPDTWKQSFGDETIAARYFGPAHTKGDIVIHFEKANV